MEPIGLADALSDLLCDPTHESRFKRSVFLRWSSDTDKRDIRRQDRRQRIGRRLQSSAFNSGKHALTEVRLYNRRLTLIDNIDLVLINVHSHDFMSIARKTGRRYCTDVTDSKNTYLEFRRRARLGLCREIRRLRGMSNRIIN